MKPKNVKECDKRNSHISSKLHMICISSNNFRYPVAKTFTTLHPNFVTNDEWLPPVIKATSQCTRSLYTALNTLKFPVCVHQ